MLHAFLPPVNVELSIHFGGAVDAVTDCRILIIQVSEIGCVSCLQQTQTNKTSDTALPANAELVIGLLCSQLVATWASPQATDKPFKQCIGLSERLHVEAALQATVLSDDAAVMALDRRGRITFATDRLAAMLGYPVSALVKMDLSALLPQPYAQLHGAWFKVSSGTGALHMLAM